MTDTCEQLSFVIVGHVDHGKSTVIGRLLADTGSLPEGKLEQVKTFCARNSRPFEYAFLLDTLRDEQAQGITIETTRIFFRTPNRRYMILDAPGHIEFLKNMVTGAAKADAALLVIDAKEGIRENSKRHGVLLSLLGIRQVVVLINKMDLVGFDQKEFEKIRDEYGAFLKNLDVKPQGFIPISAFHGDNLFQRSERMSWYQGPLVLDAIEAFRASSEPQGLPFRMPVQDVYKFTRDGDDRRIVVGTVESGTLSANDRLVFYPSGKKSSVKSLEAFHAKVPERVSAGEAIGFQMNEQVYLKRGEIACKEGEPPVWVASRIAATVFWLGREPMKSGKRYFLKLGTSRCEAQLVTVKRVVDTERLSEQVADQVACHQIAECVFDLDHPIAVEKGEGHPTLGRFVLMDGYDLSGGGVVQEILEDPQLGRKVEIETRELKWESGLISTEEREIRHGHPAFLILITGAAASPRKEIAKALEKRLFENQHQVYFMGFGNLIHGVGSQVERSRHEEQVRMAAEVAQICLGAGNIVILSAMELGQDDFQTFRIATRGRTIHAVWVGDQVTTDLAPDQRVSAPVSADAERAVSAIIDQLKQSRLLRWEEKT